MAPRDARLSAFGGSETEPVEVQPQASEEPPARSVSEVIAQVNRLLSPSLNDVWIRGELSGFRPAGSGHWYFDLKDEGAILKAAMFRGSNTRVKFRPEEGMEVLVRGRVSVYADRGSLQVVVQEMRPVGIGELALAFQQLKAKLEAEGLFASHRKRPIPQFARTIGVVTSLNAAALRDICHVATRRHPGVKLLVANARVQGEGAALEIAAAIRRLNQHRACDVIIVGRGGGSIEDLWAFNEEVVVRAVCDSEIPVVSAVGHETDFTLCDFAADYRAATPSAAAETVALDAETLLGWFDSAEERLEQALRRAVPDMRRKLDERTERLEACTRRFLKREEELLAQRAARLNALSPLAVLSRGYAVAQTAASVVRSIEQVKEGDKLEIIVPDGRIDATVKSTRKETHDVR